jgi:hypothetical protein
MSALLAACPLKHVKYTSGGGITLADCAVAAAVVAAAVVAAAATGAVNAV